MTDREPLTFGPIDATAIRREITWGAPGFLAIAGCFATWILAPYASLSFDELAAATLVVIPGVIASFSAWLAYYRARRTRVRVWASSDGLFLSTGQKWDHVASGGGFVSGDVACAADGSFQVDLHRALRPRIRLLVPSADEARALLATLGLDRREGTTLFRVRTHKMPGLAAVLGAVCATWLGTFLWTDPTITKDEWPFVHFYNDPPLEVAIVVTGLAVLAWFLSRASIAVGADGVHLRSIVRHRFIPHAAITAIEALSRGVAIVVDGERLSLDTRGERLRAGIRCTDPVYDALRLAWGNAQRGGNLHRASTLARGERSLEAWIESLRRFGVTRAVGYRDVAIEEEDLLGLLANASVPAELRIGAAIALSANQESVPKLRIAADEVADPAIRDVALAAVDARGPEDLTPVLDAALHA